MTGGRTLLFILCMKSIYGAIKQWLLPCHNMQCVRKLTLRLLHDVSMFCLWQMNKWECSKWIIEREPCLSCRNEINTV